MTNFQVLIKKKIKLTLVYLYDSKFVEGKNS